MTADDRVRQLVERILESGGTAENVCAEHPTLLPDVLKQLERLKRVDRELEMYFPTETRDHLTSSHPVAPRMPQIDGYEVQGVLGHGGMGIVFQAIHLDTNRTVAVKMLRHTSTAGAQELERFSQEYRLLARLNHPRIVQVYDVGMTDDQPFFTMEFVHGKTLETITSKGPQNSKYAAAIVHKLADAVAAAHQHEIIHRDLKPSNVLLTVDQEPKVTDFGLARLTSGSPALTMTGARVGTPSYMAPEQAAGRNREIGPAVDIYALGAILYELMTGRPPYQGESPADTIRQILTLEPVRPSRLNSKVHRDLETICMKCLEKEVRNRYATASQVRERLQMFLDGRPIPDRPIGNWERAWRWCKRNPPLASTIALSALLLFALTAVSLVFGIQEGRNSRQLREALQKSQRQEILANWDYGRQLCEAGEVGHGLLVIADAMETAPSTEPELRESLALELATWRGESHTLHKLLAHPEPVLAMAASPDGKRCVTGCSDGVLRVWDLESGTSRELVQVTGPIPAVAWSNAGDAILVGRSDGKLQIWNERTNENYIASVHSAEITSLAIHPDGKYVLTGSADKSACLWNLTTRSIEKTLPHDSPVFALAFHPDGEMFATGSGNQDVGELRFYNAGNTDSEPTFRGSVEKSVRSVAFSPDGETLVVGDEDWETGFWDVDRKLKMAATDFTNGKVCAAAYSPDNRTVLIGSHESSIAMFWDADRVRAMWDSDGGPINLSARSLARPTMPTVPHLHPITSVSFVPPDGAMFLTASMDGYVRIWKQATRLQKKQFTHDSDRPAFIRAIAISPDGDLAATAGQNGKVQFWTTADGQLNGPALDCADPLRAIAFIPDGRRLLTGSKGGWLRLWDVATRRAITEPVANPEGVSGFSLSIAGDELFVGGGGNARRWRVQPFEILGSPIEHCNDAEVSVATAASRDRYLTLGEDGKVKLWDHAGNMVAELSHDQEVRCGTFSRNGQFAMTGSDDKTVRIWNASNGALRSTLTHNSEVFSIASLDEHRIITGTREGAQIWDTTFQRRIGPVCDTGNDVMSIACSRDGTTIVMGDWEGTGVIWNLPAPLPIVKDLRRALEMEVGLKLDAGGGRKVLAADESLRWHDTHTAANQP